MHSAQRPPADGEAAIKPTHRRSSRALPAGARAPTRSRTAPARGETAPAAAQRLESGPLNQYLGYYLRRLYDDYRRHFVAQGRELDLQPREVGALFTVGFNPGLTPSQLSAALALEGAQITAMLNMFDQRGLLERRVSESDARSRLVYLTPAGEEMLERVGRFVEGFDRTFSRGGLDDAELRQLITLLSKLHASLHD